MSVAIKNTFSRSNEIDVKFFSGRNCPAEIFELRRKGFIEERGFLPDAKLLGPNDELGTHIGIYDGTGVLLAVHREIPSACRPVSVTPTVRPGLCCVTNRKRWGLILYFKNL